MPPSPAPAASSWRRRYLCQDLPWPDPGTRHRAQLVVHFSVVASTLLALFGLEHLFGLRYVPGAVLLGSLALISAGIPLVLRWTRSPSVGVHLFGVVILLGVGSLTTARDDLGVPILMYCALIPLFAAYVAGRAAAWLWTLLCSLVCAAAFLRKELGFAQISPLLQGLTQTQKDLSDILGLVGLLVLLLVVALAIDDRRLQEEQLRREMNQRLNHSRRMENLGLLAAGVAHDINNPLSAALSSISFIRRRLGELPEASLPKADLQELVESAGDAVDGCTRVADIVRDLRTFASPERLPENALNAALELAIRLANAELRFRVRVVTELAPVEVRAADAGLLCELFLGMLLAIARRVPEGAPQAHEVRVRSWTVEDGVHVEVRALSSSIDPRQGSGAPVSAELAALLGGRLQVESDRFLVWLPR